MNSPGPSEPGRRARAAPLRIAKNNAPARSARAPAACLFGLAVDNRRLPLQLRGSDSLRRGIDLDGWDRLLGLPQRVRAIFNARHRVSEFVLVFVAVIYVGFLKQ
jgi:hypothetical protein